MPEFKIISDSSCDLSSELVNKHNIAIVPYYVSLDGEHYLKENIEITKNDFYKTLRNENVFPKTSLPSIQEYMDEFKKHLQQEQDILCFTLTSKFSGSYQSAANAASILREDYPERKIEVIDSRTVTAAQGMLVLEAVKMREAGLPFDEIVEKSKQLRKHCVIYVTVDSLVYLQKGGRIGKVSALAGSLLNIRPVIVARDGELMPLSKVRGHKKAVSEIIKLINKDIATKKEEYSVFVLATDEPIEVRELAQEINSNFGYEIAIEPVDVGVTIGAHIGPTAIGIGYIKKYETL